jgi:hypothetical protein
MLVAPMIVLATNQRENESQRQLARRQPVPVSQFGVGSHCRRNVDLRIALAETGKLGDPAGGFRVGQVLAGERAEGERRVRQAG